MAKDMNSSVNEQWNSWMDCVVPSLRYRTGDTFKANLLLLDMHWNTFIVSQAGMPEMFRAATPKSRLKRTRDSSASSPKLKKS